LIVYKIFKNFKANYINKIIFFRKLNNFWDFFSCFLYSNFLLKVSILVFCWHLYSAHLLFH